MNSQQLERVYVAVGSNLGDPETIFGQTRLALDKLGTELQLAPIYRSAPVDCPPGSPDFLNSAVSFLTSLGPFELLGELQEIERELGRPEKRATTSPRPVDLDILLYGTHRIETVRLTVPHPRMLDRNFVLIPLSRLKDCMQTSETFGLEEGTLKVSPELKQVHLSSWIPST